MQMRYLAVVLTLVVFVLPRGAAAATSKLEVSGWIPYWRAATGTADALQHLNAFTEINPFVFRIKSDGTLANPDALDEEPWASFLATARAQKIRIVPTVMWSDGNAIHATLSNAKKRVALEDELAALVKSKGFDGIDIDFEGKKAETKGYFSTFLKGLYQRVGNKWLMCTVEARTPPTSRYTGTPPKDAYTYANDFAALAKYCDRVRFMAYDQGAIDVKLNADALGPYAPVADPKWVEKTITLAAQQIPKRKIEIGVATYGYEYDVTPYTNGGYQYDTLWSFNPGYASQIIAQYHVPATRNQANEMSLVYTPTSTATTLPGGADTLTQSNSVVATTASSGVTGTAISTTTPFRMLWWSDAQAIGDKVALAQRLGVRGISIFKVDGGEDPYLWSVLPKVR
jgi:spore germination protein YaaH